MDHRVRGRVGRVAHGTPATGDGARVHLWTYEGGTNQQWRPEPVGTTGTYRFTARHSGTCLTVDNGSTADGARLSQQPRTTAAGQTFTLAG
ncbi:RICIN domain-containing protein [Streptomyces sp. SP18CS02]|uniref:RICIN domain-containing protein n=1 Tax=Streptomyces sp. SP18CS02 TaxID=3002531 RepID=UPI003FCC4306